MSRSTLLFLALVWAAVLLPRALRDVRDSPLSTVTGFTDAMARLAVADQRLLFVPHGSGRTAVVHPRRVAADRRLRRRRLLLVQLLGGSVASLALAIVVGGALPWTVAGIVTTALVGYCVLLRAAVRRSAGTSTSVAASGEPTRRSRTRSDESTRSDPPTPAEPAAVALAAPPRVRTVEHGAPTPAPPAAPPAHTPTPAASPARPAMPARPTAPAASATSAAVATPALVEVAGRVGAHPRGDAPVRTPTTGARRRRRAIAAVRSVARREQVATPIPTPTSGRAPTPTPTPTSGRAPTPTRLRPLPLRVATDASVEPARSRALPPSDDAPVIDDWPVFDDSPLFPDSVRTPVLVAESG